MIPNHFFTTLKPVTSPVVGTADIGYINNGHIELLDSVLNVSVSSKVWSTFGITDPVCVSSMDSSGYFYSLNADNSITALLGGSADLNTWSIFSTYSGTHRGSSSGICQVVRSRYDGSFSIPEMSPYYSVSTFDYGGAGPRTYPTSGLSPVWVPGCVDCMTDGSNIIVGRTQGSSAGGQYIIFNATTGALVRTVGAGGFVNKIQCLSNSRIIGIESESIVVRDPSTSAGTLITTLPTDGFAPYDISVSPNGQWLVVILFKESTRHGLLRIYSTSSFSSPIQEMPIGFDEDYLKIAPVRYTSVAWKADSSKVIAISGIFRLPDATPIGFVGCNEVTETYNPFFLP